MSRLNNYVITTSQSLAKDYANDAKIIKVLDDTLNLLENLPSQVDFVFHIQLSSEKMGATRNEVLINSRKNFYNWLVFLFTLLQEDKEARFFDQMLCDYVHPNAGSHVLIIDKTLRINDEQFIYSLAYEPKSEEL